MSEEVDVVVVGAGQAGLCVSRELTRAGVAHVVLERDRVASAWAGRWDSFCLVTPNGMSLPTGGQALGGDPAGYLQRDAIVAYLEDFGRGAPVRSGVHVRSLRRTADGNLTLDTGDGLIAARVVVAATGAFQRAHRPSWVAKLPRGLAVLDAGDYRNPGALPTGAALVVGSGQTGCQIAEELHRSGMRVVLSCGRAPWVPRRLEDRDIVEWLDDAGFWDMPPSALPSPKARLVANPQATGAAGGHDLTFRTLAALGVELVGRVVDVDGDTAVLVDDLPASVAFGDARYAEIRALIGSSRRSLGLSVPQMPDPAPFAAAAPDTLDLSGFGSVIMTTGFRPAYQEWIHAPGAFDDLGFPVHRDGASTAMPGLYFVGVHFLRTRKSSLLMGVGDDAAVVAEQIASSLAGRTTAGAG